jgi:tyrosyl-tRNA synthetase
MIMQAYDFYTLFQKYGCQMEFGGDDQWSNMLAGTELIRRKLGKDAYALTINLLTNSEGKKMGKTQSGAVWLDPKKTSPYEFFQYWRNINDNDVIKCMKMLTFIPLDDINMMAEWKDQKINEAKEIFAFELTKMVHGEDEAIKARDASHSLFGENASSENMPGISISEEDLTEGTIDIRKLLQKAGFVSSLSEGKRAVEQGGVSVNGDKIEDPFTKFTIKDFKDQEFILKKGKKKFALIKAD